MKLHNLLVILFLYCASGNAQDTLKVMTYNIYHGEQAYHSGASNLESVAELINRNSPDIVALQEVDSLTGRSAGLCEGIAQNQIEVLAALTGMHGYFGQAITYDGGGYGEGILSKQRMQIKKYYLPTPKGGEKRTLLTGRFKTKSGKPVIFAGTHLCHQYPENRMAQVRRINEVLISNDTPVILGGDFNFSPTTVPYNEMKAEWSDASILYGEEELTYPSRNPERRIDYLFFSKKEKWNVLKVEVIPVEYSDHMPIVSTLVLQ